MAGFVEFKIGNKMVRKNLGQKKIHSKLRHEALKKRTAAELWAEEIIRQNFHENEFQIEHVFQFRRFDFYFPSLKFALEIDGGYHNEFKQKQYDAQVDQLLYRRYRIKVFRVKNFDNLQLLTILNHFKKSIKPSPAPSKKAIEKRNKKKLLREINRQRNLEKFQASKVVQKKEFVPKFILRKK